MKDRASRRARWMNRNLRRSPSTLLLVAATLWFWDDSASVQAQIAPPTVRSISPTGGQIGTTLELAIEGTNLGGGRGLIFSESGFSAEILEIEELPIPPLQRRPGVVVTSAIIEDRATRNRLRVALTIEPGVEPGIYGLRVETPLGVTNLMSFAAGPFPELEEPEDNNSLETAPEVELPVTVRGTISKLGEEDYYRFSARKGQELVFSIEGSALGSRLDGELALVDARGGVLASSDGEEKDAWLAYTVKEDGEYWIRVSDRYLGSGDSYPYRLRMGEYGWVTEIFPLGVRAGERAEVTVKGPNIGGRRYGSDGREEPGKAGSGGARSAEEGHDEWGEDKEGLDEERYDGVTLPVEAAEAGWRRSTPVRVPGALNPVRLAVGSYPEILEVEPNDSLEQAQRVSFPVTINGRIFNEGTPPGEEPAVGDEQMLDGKPDQDLFRFSARKGQHLVFEVEAEALDSRLDSILEILDSEGRPVPRAALRCLAQTTVTLRDTDSRRTGIRIENWDDFAINDFVMIGGEVLQLEGLPLHPDADALFKGFQGRRIAFLDTTSEAHALGTAVYKVAAFPPGTEFAPNGMPVFRLDYRNDDGGPFFGKDSRLSFEVPEDGEYIVRLRDVRGFEGENFAYRLTVREASPDFMLLMNRDFLNLPPGGQVPLTVTAYRVDDFDGDIEVQVKDLPPDVTATTGIIPSGSNSTIILLSAAEETSFSPSSFQVVGRARVGEPELVREVDLTRRLPLVATANPPEIVVAAAAPRVEIVPGQETRLTLQLERRHGFQARVPMDLRNLPHGVRILDIGLNGVLVTEEETSRSVTLYAEPWVKPQRRPVYVIGRVETNSPILVEHASPAVELVVLPQRAAQ